MRALQVWLPAYLPCTGYPSAERDYQRAVESWHGEASVFTIPGLNRPVRWVDEDITMLAVPAEQPDRWDIYHVGRGGYAWGRGAKERFPGGKIEQTLLDLWLNATFGRVPPIDSIAVELPRFRNSEFIGYAHMEVPLEPGPTVPIISHHPPIPHSEERGTAEEVQPADANGKDPAVWAVWPPPDVWTAPISPSEESRACGISSEGTLVGRLTIFGPLQAAFPVLGLGFDDLFLRDKAREIAEQSVKNPQDALRGAEHLAAPHVTKALATCFEAIVLPQVAAAEPGSELAAFSRWDDFKDLYEALRSAKFREEASRPTEVQRVRGVSGLMLALLVERLEELKSFRTCNRCGRIIRGRRSKKYCSKDENPDCYRGRRSADKATERVRGARN